MSSSPPVAIEPDAVAQAKSASAVAYPSLRSAMVAEMLGTFVLVFFGVGAVNAAVITGAQSGLWQVAVVWAVGVSLGIYASAAVSNAHLNPAITLAAVVYDGFPPLRGFGYWLAQLLGAALASLVLYAMFDEAIIEFERIHGLLRGGPGSELSAMVFGEYFPNPAIFGTAENAWRVVSMKSAFVAEMVGTGMLALMICAITHHRNEGRPAATSAAVMIGLSVAAIISVIAPLTQAGLNPARDLGPRLVSYFLGWGDIAIPGPRGGWLVVYVLAPMIGALLGGGVGRFAMTRLRGPQRPPIA